MPATRVQQGIAKLLSRLFRRFCHFSGHPIHFKYNVSTKALDYKFSKLGHLVTNFSLAPLLTWPNRHAIGAFLLVFPSLPSIVSSTVSCLSNSAYSRDMLVAVLCSSALHHTNFSNLSSIMRTLLSTLTLCAAFFITTFYTNSNVSKSVKYIIRFRRLEFG